MAAPEWEAVDLLHHHHTTTNTTTTMPPAPTPSMSHYFYGGTSSSSFNLSFADDFSIPAVPMQSEEAAELEWLSNFVDDSYDPPSYYPPEEAIAARQQPPLPSVMGSKTKRSRPTTTSQRSKNKLPAVVGDDYTSSEAEAAGGARRRCTHCASEKTPQWRTGPLGPKTLCNACGVRYKSGRLVPEYRPAASPTFVLTQHSNSHRKVMEMRRQKELIHIHGGGGVC